MASVNMLNGISYYAISISVCWCCVCVLKDCFAPRTKSTLSMNLGYFVYSVYNRKHEKSQSDCIILAAGD